MHKTLLLGGGKIGRMIAKLLSDAGNYLLTVADIDEQHLAKLARLARVSTQRLDVTNHSELTRMMKDFDSVISALSYEFNLPVAEAALAAGASYFDLTEDRETTRRIREVANQAAPHQVFVPQCGLAPGFVSIAAHDLCQSFDVLDKVHMRVGALPLFPSNDLKYNLTWSTDGLINEYCNPCEAIHEGRRCEVLPLEGLEHLSLDGIRYEAFNTSGGLGSLCETLEGKVRELNYKTIRYLGHRYLMAFLVNELRLGTRRPILKDVLETAVPVTFQDVVIVFCTVAGERGGQLVQASDARKIYQQHIDGENWSAIQITTAAGLCAVLDLHVSGELPKQGFVKQESVSLSRFLQNRFGQYYRSGVWNRLAMGSETPALADDSAP